MAIHLAVDADLEFSVAIPGSSTVTGSLSGSGSALELRVSDPFLFAGRSDSGAVRGLAKGLADRGMTITVVTQSGPLATLGVAKSSWLQRRLTGSRHIRIQRGAGLWSLVRGRSRAPSGGALPTARMTPPTTLFPLAPTMARRPRRPVTTTHDPERGGNPRLILPVGEYARAEDRPQDFPLRDDVTTIGSGADCDIRLAGLEPLHAEIRHDDEDEFVLVRIDGAPLATRVHGAPADSARLRTGTGIDLGRWHLTYFREEYADHGRPYGGRIGGELGHQRSQPSRAAQLRQAEENG
jgi:hypothetical protein